MKTQLAAELRQGIGSVWLRFLIPFAIGGAYSWEFFYKISIWGMHQETALKASLGDCLIYLFQGAKEYIPSFSRPEPFEVPIPYLFINLVLAVMIGNYAVKDLHGYGKLKLVRCRKRAEWWLCKCLWNVGTVLGYYLFLYAGVVLMCAVHYRQMDTALLIHQDVLKQFLSGGGLASASESTGLLVMAVLLPLATSLAMSLVQMALAFLTSPTVSYVILIAVYVFSAFKMQWYLPGNYMMMYRSCFVNEKGVHLGLSMAVDGVLSMLAVIVGYLRFQKYDIYGEKK